MYNKMMMARRRREGIFKPQGTQVLEKCFTPDGSGPGALTLLSSTGRLRRAGCNDSEVDNAVAAAK